MATNATIGFFKTGAPVTVGILGPNACDQHPDTNTDERRQPASHAYTA